MRSFNINSIFALISVVLCQNALSQYIPFCKNGKWGFASTDGKILIPCSYEEIDFYSDDSLAKVKKSGKYGYINKNGLAVIPFDYDNCFRIYEVYQGKYSTGIKINPSIHLNNEWVPSDVKNYRYIVSKNRMYGVICVKKGKPKILIPLQYEKIQFDLNRMAFHCGSKRIVRYFDMNGQEIKEEQVDDVKSNNNFSVEENENINLPKIIKINGKVGVIQRPKNLASKIKFDTIIPVIYDDIMIDKFDGGYVPKDVIFGVKIANKWGIIDGKNSSILPIHFDSINFEVSSGSKHLAEYKRLFAIKENCHWGILGKKNDSTDAFTILLPSEYDSISKMYNPYLLVKKEDKFQLYNTEAHKFINDKKYSSIAEYEHESVNGFDLFQVKNTIGQTVYIGGNGVEFFTN